MDQALIFRVAQPSDAKQILEIYAPYILHTSYTFETEVPGVDEFADRISSYLEHWPWLVCEAGGIIAGYAYASRYRERTGYQWCAECSVYIHPDHRKKKIANVLYEKLFEILKVQGYRNVYAVINTPNDPSVAFHEKCGFRFFAMYEQVGWKLGQWKNVGWWRRVLNEFSDDPLPPKKFSALAPGETGLDNQLRFSL
jgi:phosphinothricin acetyltransferase